MQAEIPRSGAIMIAKPLRIVAVALSLLALAACSGQKEPANQAIASVESSFAEIKADSERFASEQAAAIEKRVAELKASLEKKEYKTVVTDAPAVQKEITDLRATVATRRQEFEAASARATDAWNGFAAEMPRYLDTLQKRIDVLVKQRKVAKGTSEDSLLLDNVRNLWADASNLFSAGKPVDAAARAEEARAKAQQLAQKLGAKLE
jgi:hypothetical protein